MRITIIGGYGRMGRWFAMYLKREGHQVTICGPNPARLLQAERELGVPSAPVEHAVAEADAIILSVPIGSFEDAVRQIAPHTRDGQLVFDVTSIKAKPVEMMHRNIKRATVLGTHPMFGPGAAGIEGQRVALTPTNPREEALAARIKRYLEARGGTGIIMSPQEHDELMSVVLGLSHFVALAAADTLGSLDNFEKAGEVGGPTFTKFLTLARAVLAEDPDFYATLQMELPDTAAVESLFMRKAGEWLKLVEQKDRAAFAKRMGALERRRRL